MNAVCRTRPCLSSRRFNKGRTALSKSSWTWQLMAEDSCRSMWWKLHCVLCRGSKSLFLFPNCGQLVIILPMASWAGNIWFYFICASRQQGYFEFLPKSDSKCNCWDIFLTAFFSKEAKSPVLTCLSVAFFRITSVYKWHFHGVWHLKCLCLETDIEGVVYKNSMWPKVHHGFIPMGLCQLILLPQVSANGTVF